MATHFFRNNIMELWVLFGTYKTVLLILGLRDCPPFMTLQAAIKKKNKSIKHVVFLSKISLIK